MTNFFQGARDFTINGGTFGQDHSRHTTYRGPVHLTNDYTQRTTHYGGYVNRGQHASGGGTINNHGPQTTNNGPVYDYQQYSRSRSGNVRSPRPPSPLDDEFNAPLRNQTPNSRRDQQYRRRYPPPDPPFDNDPTYRDPDRDVNDDVDEDLYSDEERPTLAPRPRAQLRAVPPRRPQGEPRGNRDDFIDEELRNLSPEMQRYIQALQQRNGAPIPAVRPERDLQDHMADMQLDDAESSRSPAGRSSPRGRPQNPPRRGLNPPLRGTRARPRPARVSESYRENPPEEEESDSDGDIPFHGHSVTNTNSQNVSSTTVVDSHNDNSTKTEISKMPSAR